MTVGELRALVDGFKGQPDDRVLEYENTTTIDNSRGTGAGAETHGQKIDQAIKSDAPGAATRNGTRAEGGSTDATTTASGDAPQYLRWVVGIAGGLAILLGVGIWVGRAFLRTTPFGVFVARFPSVLAPSLILVGAAMLVGALWPMLFVLILVGVVIFLLVTKVAGGVQAGNRLGDSHQANNATAMGRAAAMTQARDLEAEANAHKEGVRNFLAAMAELPAEARRTFAGIVSKYADTREEVDTINNLAVADGLDVRIPLEVPQPVPKPAAPAVPVKPEID